MRKRRESDGSRNEDGTPIRDKNKASVREPSVNDEIRQRMRKRIQMMEDSDPEEDVKWRESDVF